MGRDSKEGKDEEKGNGQKERYSGKQSGNRYQTETRRAESIDKILIAETNNFDALEPVLSDGWLKEVSTRTR